MESGQCANCGAMVPAGSRECAACGQATAVPVPAALRVAASAAEQAPAASPAAAKSGCGLLVWLTTGVGCMLVIGLLALLAALAVAAAYLTADQPVPPPVRPGAPAVTGSSPAQPAPAGGQSSRPAPAGNTCADYIGTWFAVTGEPGADNNFVLRLEGKQLVGIGNGGATRIPFALQADGSIYGIARGEGMNVPVHGQLTADKRQLNLTALYEASEPSTVVFQRAPFT